MDRRAAMTAMHSPSRTPPAVRDYRVATPGRLPLLTLWLPLLLTAGLVVGLGLSQAQRVSWSTPAFLAALGVALTLLYQRRGIRLEGTALRVRSTMFQNRTELAAIDLSRARVVDLAEHTELAPTGKAIGYGLPGFKSGHFRLRNGQRAFCLLTDASRVLALPLHDGRWLLLSPEQPRQLLQDLQRLAARAA